MEQVSSCRRCGGGYLWDDSLGSSPGVCSWRCARDLSLPRAKRCRCGILHRGEESYSCGVERIAICIECARKFSYICRGRRRSACSRGCIALLGTHSEAAKAARSDPDQIRLNAAKHRAALREKYGESVVNPSQLPHVKEQRRRAMEERGGGMRATFQEKHGVDNPAQLPGVGEAMRSNSALSMEDPRVKLRQMAARYPHIQPMDEFIDLEHGAWAERFQEEHGRKPHPSDLMAYFHLTSRPVIPQEMRRHYSLRDSPLELQFTRLLEGMGLRQGAEFLRRARFLRHPDTGNRLELDFYLPSRGIAFEVQDFATHDRVRNEAVDSWGNIKKGPSYHSMKMAVARGAGITLHEIWEDELEDGDTLLGRMEEIILPRGE